MRFYHGLSVSVRFCQVLKYHIVSGFDRFCQVLIVLFVLCRVLQVHWGGRALRGLQAFRAPRGLPERRAREATRGRQELRDQRETWWVNVVLLFGSVCSIFDCDLETRWPTL